eukprot:94419-Rhodomonas_salina.2
MSPVDLAVCTVQPADRGQLEGRTKKRRASSRDHAMGKWPFFASLMEVEPGERGVDTTVRLGGNTRNATFKLIKGTNGSVPKAISVVSRFVQQSAPSSFAPRLRFL